MNHAQNELANEETRVGLPVDQSDQSSAGAPTQADDTNDTSRSKDTAAAIAGPPALSDQTNYLPRRQIISVFLATASVGFTSLLDQTMVAVALPVISSVFHSGSDITWVANAYFVTNTACNMLYGRISDIWSRKSVLLTMLAIFFFGELASALAQSFAQLLVFRSFVGIGGGGLSTLAQVIVSDVVSLQERGKYQGILGASVALSYAVGPIIGGAFVSSGNWRWIFWINLPLTAIATANVIFIMPLKPVTGSAMEKLAKVDFLGSFLILVGTALCVLALTWGGATYSWSDPHVLAPLIVGAAVFIIFVIWEWKGPKHPLMPVYVFKNPVVVGALITQTINGFLTVVQVFYLPTWYQVAYSYSPTKSGALLLPITLVQTFTSSACGIVLSKTGRYREMILMGWGLWAIGLGLLSTLGRDASVAKQIGYSILTGFGVGQTFQPSLVALQGAVDRKDMAIITSLRSFVRNLGGALGLAITGSIVNNVLRSHLNKMSISGNTYTSIVNNPANARQNVTGDVLEAVIDGYHQGFRVVFFMLSGLAAFGFIVALCLMTHRELGRADDAKLKDAGKDFIRDLKEKKRGKSDNTGAVDTEKDEPKRND